MPLLSFIVCHITRAKLRRKKNVLATKEMTGERKITLVGKTALHRNNILQTRATPPTVRTAALLEMQASSFYISLLLISNTVIYYTYVNVKTML